MKKITLVALSFLALSCNEKKASFDSLSAGEKDNLRLKGQTTCLNNFSAAYSNFKEYSDAAFTSTAFNRGNGWLHKYSEGTTLLRSTEIRVWKRNGVNEIYYYVIETAGGDKNEYFLRHTLEQNEDIISGISMDHCGASKIYEVSTGKEGPLNLTYKYIRNVTNGTEEYTDRYSLDFYKPAAFARYSLNRSVIPKTSEGKVEATKSYSSTFEAQASLTFSHTDYNQYAQKFCEVTSTETYRLDQSGQGGFDIDNCVSSKPAEWDLTI